MGKDYSELVSSPYDDDPPSRRRWLVPVVGVGLLAVVVVIGLLVFRPSDDAENAIDAATGTTVDGAVPGGDAEDSASTTTVPPFDSEGLGMEQVWEESDVGAVRTEQALEGAARFLDVDGSSVVGGLPHGLPIDVAWASGVIVDPYEASFGGPGYCLIVITTTGDSSSCFAYDPPLGIQSGRAGNVGGDIVAWVGLPEDAVAGVLVVNDANIAWQQPRDGVVVFRYEPIVGSGDSIRVQALDGDRNVIGEGDLLPPPEPLTTYVEPILGFGDFSGVSAAELDRVKVAELTVACANANGVQVALNPNLAVGGWVDLSALPEGDQTAAAEIVARCRLGLNLPPSRTSEDQRRETFAFLTDLWHCMTEAGFEIAGPPQTFEDWDQTPYETRWEPALMIQFEYGDSAMESLQTCQGG